jgi:hypothetical protein
MYAVGMESEPFLAVGPDLGELTVNFGAVTVAPLPPGRRDTEDERAAQRAAILKAALRSVEQYGALGLQPEKVAAATNGSLTSQSIRRAFRQQLDGRDASGRKPSLRAVLEDSLIDSQLRRFQYWLQSEGTGRLRSDADMVRGLRRIAGALLRNQALTRLRTSDRKRLEAFLMTDERAEPLVAALCDLAIRCLAAQRGPKPRPKRVRHFVHGNLHLLADDVALIRLETEVGARCFVRHLKAYAAK